MSIVFCRLLESGCGWKFLCASAITIEYFRREESLAATGNLHRKNGYVYTWNEVFGDALGHICKRI